MSDVVFTDFDSFSLGGFDTVKKSHDDRDKRIGIIKIIAVVLSILMLMEGLMYLIIIPCFSKPGVSYTGLETISQSQVNEKLSSMLSSPWIKFDTEKATSILLSDSSIENVSVTKQFPDKILINVFERKAVAKTLVEMDGCSVPVQIDKNGVLFTSAGNNIIQDSSVPLVSGLPVENMSVGMRLPQKYRALMNEIADIKKLPQNYFAAVSEMQVVSKEYGNYELVLYPVKTRVKVLTDRALNEDALKYMMVVLDVVNSIEPDVSEVDLRYGSVSYRTPVLNK